MRKKRPISGAVDAYSESVEERIEQFGETFMERPCWDLRNCAIEPLREIMVSAAEVLVTVDLPYAEEGKVQVKPLDEESIEISAEMKRRIRLEELGITHRKGEIRKFHCQMKMPVPVDMNKMKVNYKKRILEIRLPRKH